MANNNTLNLPKVIDLMLGSDDPEYNRKLWYALFNELAKLLNDMPIYWGEGTPEGSVTAAYGIYVDTTNKKLYVKESGSGDTGWVLK